jgi:hypothetical protein
MTPEIRTLWLLFVCNWAIVGLLSCDVSAPTHATSDLIGPIHSFTTRRIPARDLVEQGSPIGPIRR